MNRALFGASAFYAFLFLALGAYLPFWPLWLADWGLAPGEIGGLMAASIAVRVFMGLAVPYAADRAGRPRRALALISVLAALFYLAHEAAGARPALYAATILAAAAVAGLAPIGDALTLRAAAREGFAYSTARGVGSAAFLVANLLGGVAVSAFGSDAALWWIVICYLACAPFGLRHPGGAGAPLPTPRLADALALVGRRDFLLLMVAMGALNGAHAPIYAYGSLHWREAGIGDETIGALWAFGVLCEVVLMIGFGRALLARWGAAGAVALAAAAGVLRWVAMAFDPSLALLWPLQATHALTFGAAYLGGVEIAGRAAGPALASTAQGLAGAVAGGIGMAAASLAAAWAYPLWGGGAFLIGAALSALGLFAALALRQGGVR